MMFGNTRQVSIEWGDCDPAGIVFYPRYFAMFDASTAALFAAATGMTKFEILRHYGIAGFPMVDTRASFKRPSRFGDVVRIETRLSGLRRSSFDIEHRIYLGEDVIAEGFETRVWAAYADASRETIKAAPIPEALRNKLMGEAQE